MWRGSTSPTTIAPSPDVRFDTVICLNVLEHVDDDISALHAIRRLLGRAAGSLLLVPALQALYGTMRPRARATTAATIATALAESAARRATSSAHRVLQPRGDTGLVVGRASAAAAETIPGGSLKLYDALVPAVSTGAVHSLARRASR